MVMAIKTQPVPLKADADGVIRVGGTRVTLETFYRAFEGGATAEEICARFDVLKLADVYAAISYCLNHPQQVAAYLGERGRPSPEIAAARKTGPAIRKRLERRKAAGTRRA